MAAVRVEVCLKLIAMQNKKSNTVMILYLACVTENLDVIPSLTSIKTNI